MLHFKTVEEYNEKFNSPTLHPLISLVDLNKAAKFRRTKLKLDFYAVVIKESKCGDLRYGLKYYDYAEGTIVFLGPGQVIASEPEGEWHQPYGTALIFHPDLLKGTTLARQMADYSFFGYQSAEALHVSTQERTQIDGCFANIALEIKQNLDQHSKTLIIANLELLLIRYHAQQLHLRRTNQRGRAALGGLFCSGIATLGQLFQRCVKKRDRQNGVGVYSFKIIGSRQRTDSRHGKTH
jgi:AraC family transcriptional regulator, transcriptional activator of pobA